MEDKVVFQIKFYLKIKLLLSFHKYTEASFPKHMTQLTTTF